jgi:hypothetical protein
MLHAADVRVAEAPSAATTTMMDTMSDRHTTLRWIVESALLNEWCTAPPRKAISLTKINICWQ